MDKEQEKRYHEFKKKYPDMDSELLQKHLRQLELLRHFAIDERTEPK